MLAGPFIKDLQAGATSLGLQVEILHASTDAEIDAAFVKLLAQKIAGQGSAIAVLSAAKGQPTLVIAQTPGLPLNCGALLRDVLGEFGGRGGGSADMAQGGVADAAKLEPACAALLVRVKKVLSPD